MICKNIKIRTVEGDAFVNNKLGRKNVADNLTKKSESLEEIKLDVTSNLVWKEFELAFSYAKLIRIYTDKRRKWNRWANWIVIALVCCTSFSFLFDSLYSVIFSVISSITVIVKEISPAFKQQENDLSSLDKAADFFAEYQVDMEKMFYELMYSLSLPDMCYKHFFELRKRSTSYYSIVNKYYRGVSHKDENKVNQSLNDYAKQFENN
ncbi:MAG: hypothetical protein ACI4AH_01900 [Muribaculaceae bacterium]